MPTPIATARLREIADRFSVLKMGVIGDMGLDGYWYADMAQSVLARETPRFPRPVKHEVYSPGAGANVAHNLKVLGVGEVVVFSVLGDDWRGMILRRELANHGIVVDHLIVSPQRSTTAFIKPILMGFESQQEDARIDFENAEPLPPVLEQALIDVTVRHLHSLDGLLIADQLDANGVITDRVRKTLNSLATDHPDMIIVADSRRHIDLFRDMILKPNRQEAAIAVCPEYDPRVMTRDELAKVGMTLMEHTDRPVFVTLDGEGVLVCAEKAHCHFPAVPVSPPLDSVGAGDTFAAALAAALAVGATPWEAGQIANLAAAVVVEKLYQTGTASPAEILARFELDQAKDGEA